MTPFLAYLARAGIGFDMFINVLTGGAIDQTVSYRVAKAAGWGPNGKQQPGRKWACYFCVFLTWFVQRDHCADQFNTAPTPWFDMIRAGICFAVGIGTLLAVVHALLQYVF